jgi:hypothetical protein
VTSAAFAFERLFPSILHVPADPAHNWRAHTLPRLADILRGMAAAYKRVPGRGYQAIKVPPLPARAARAVHHARTRARRRRGVSLPSRLVDDIYIHI